MPVIVERSGSSQPLGVFETWEIANEVLLRWLRSDEAIDTSRASISRWKLNDEDTKKGILTSSYMLDLCPLCGREKFWWDVVEDQANCLAKACGAWLQRRASEKGGFDIGWPNGKRQMHVSSPEEAISKLRSWRPVEIESIARAHIEEILARRAIPEFSIEKVDLNENLDQKENAEGTLFSRMVPTTKQKEENKSTAPLGFGLSGTPIQSKRQVGLFQRPVPISNSGGDGGKDSE